MTTSTTRSPRSGPRRAPTSSTRRKSFATPEDAQTADGRPRLVHRTVRHLRRRRAGRAQGSDAAGAKRVSCYLEGEAVPEAGPGVTGVVEHRVVQVLDPTRPLRDHRVDVGADRSTRSGRDRRELRRARVPQEDPAGLTPSRSADGLRCQLGVGGASFRNRSRSWRCSAALSAPNADGGSASSSSARARWMRPSGSARSSSPAGRWGGGGARRARAPAGRRPGW